MRCQKPPWCCQFCLSSNLCSRLASLSSKSRTSRALRCRSALREMISPSTGEIFPSATTVNTYEVSLAASAIDSIIGMSGKLTERLLQGGTKRSMAVFKQETLPSRARSINFLLNASPSPCMRFSAAIVALFLLPFGRPLPMVFPGLNCPLWPFIDV